MSDSMAYNCGLLLSGCLWLLAFRTLRQWVMSLVRNDPVPRPIIGQDHPHRMTLKVAYYAGAAMTGGIYGIALGWQGAELPRVVAECGVFGAVGAAYAIRIFEGSVLRKPEEAKDEESGGLRKAC
jgi:hypothetical protein